MSAVHIIYLIQSGEAGPVLIGITGAGGSVAVAAVRRRVAALQHGNPEELHIRKLIAGDQLLERQLHVRFADHAVRDDWYAAAILDDLPDDLTYLDDEDRRRLSGALADLARGDA